LPGKSMLGYCKLKVTIRTVCPCSFSLVANNWL
jgi:hypothetical protein